MIRLFLLLIAFVLVTSGCGVNEGKNEETANTSALADTTAEPVKTEIPKEESVKLEESIEQAFDWANAEVNEENVRKALSSGIGAAMAIPLTDKTFRKYVSSADTKGEYIEITINPGMFADEKDFVKRAGGSLIAYSKILFKNPNVFELSIVVNIDDVAGGENQGVYISWQREQTDAVDYDEVLDNMFGDITIAYQLARTYRIQSELYEGLTDFDLPGNHNL